MRGLGSSATKSLLRPEDFLSKFSWSLEGLSLVVTAKLDRAGERETVVSECDVTAGKVGGELL